MCDLNLVVCFTLFSTYSEKRTNDCSFSSTYGLSILPGSSSLYDEWECIQRSYAIQTLGYHVRRKF